MDKARDAKEAMGVVIEAWRKDPKFRARVENNPKKALESKGLFLRAGEARVAVDTPDASHFVLPPNPNAGIPDEGLSAAVGGLCFNRRLPPADFLDLS